MPPAALPDPGQSIAIRAVGWLFAAALLGSAPACAGDVKIAVGSFDQSADWAASLSAANKRLAGQTLTILPEAGLFAQVMAGTNRTPGGLPNTVGVPLDLDDSEQVLMRSVIGLNWKGGGWRLTPAASLTYLNDREYSAASIYGPTTAISLATLTRLQAGPELAYEVQITPTTKIEPFVSAAWVHDLQSGVTIPTLALDLPLNNANARFSTGLAAEIGTISIRATAFYQGLGADGPSYGGELVARIPLD